MEGEDRWRNRTNSNHKESNEGIDVHYEYVVQVLHRAKVECTEVMEQDLDNIVVCT